LQLGTAPSRLFPRRHRRHTTALAIRRHRNRRFEVMSELLLSSADCLGLEERDAQGFMVMLEGMKTGGIADGIGGTGARASTRQRPPRRRRGTASNTSSNATAGVHSSSTATQPSSASRDKVRTGAEATQRTGLMPIAIGSPAVGVSAAGTVPQMVREDSLKSGTVDTSGWSSSLGRETHQQQPPQEQELENTEVVDTNSTPYDATLDDDWTNPELIAPFLAELTPGAGFQCVSLILLQHLLRSRSGYDARARQVYKRLGLLVLMWEEKKRLEAYASDSVEDEDRESIVGSYSTASGASTDVTTEAVEIRTGTDGEVIGIQHSPTAASSSSLAERVNKDRLNRKQTRPTDEDIAANASRKFEAIERAVASKLIKISNQQSIKRQKQKVNDTKQREQPSQQEQRRSDRQVQQHAPDEGEVKQRRRQQRDDQDDAPAPPNSAVSTRPGPRITRTQLMRGLKITSAGLAAGTLFAVTGGLAAPGIAAGIAAMTASTTVTAAGAAVISALTSSAAVCTIFGVGGGGLAAYKVSRRTRGVTEFEFRREDNGRARARAEAAAARARKAAAGSNLRRRLRGNAEHDQVAQAAARAAAAADAELYSTVCLSGWFRDVRDFQRAWGVNPTNPPITERLELLERFYAVYQPNKIHRCERILNHWRGEERQLWRLLRQKYGRDPDHAFPFDHGSRLAADLTRAEDVAVDRLLIELGYDIPNPEPDAEPDLAEDASIDASKAQAAKAIGRIGQRISDKILHHNYEGHGAEDLSRMENQASVHPSGANGVADTSTQDQRQDATLTKPSTPQISAAASAGAPVASDQARPLTEATAEKEPRGTSGGESATASSTKSEATGQSGGDKTQSVPRHLDTVWDYTAEYGGELYTVRWESDLLMELCDSVTDMVVDVLGAGTRELLKQTALATLVTAIAIPYAMIRAADTIDSVWTLAVERADEAGVELAKSLLESQAGHRPVTLLGYSMGARAIYSCLKELARHQEKWEDQRDRERDTESMGPDQAASAPNGKTQVDEQVYSREPAGIVEDVILMGTPNHLSIPSWEAARRVVSGRLVNCYSTKDLILSVLFQYKRMTGVLRPVCGCAPVKVPGVENYDVTHLLNSHADYCVVVGDVLKLVRHGQPRPTAGTGFRRSEIGENENDESGNGDSGEPKDAAELKEEPFIAPLGDEKVFAT